MNNLKFQLCLTVALFLLLACFAIGKAAPPAIDFDWQSFPAEGGAFGMSWSPDSQRLALSNRYSNQLWIFDLQTKAVEKQIDLPDIPENAGASSASWSPDGSLIAVAQGNIYLVDPTTGDIVQTYTKTEAHSTEHISIADIKWSSDSKFLAALEAIGYLYVFDLQAKELVTTIDLDGRENIVYSAFDWSMSNGLFAIPLMWSSTIGLWNADGTPASPYMRQDEHNQLATDCYATAGSVMNDLNSINWSNDGKDLAIGEGLTLHVCHLNEDKTIKVQYLDDEPTSLAIWSPDDHWLVSTNAYDPACWIKIFDATKQFNLVQTLQGSACGAVSMAWSPDGQYLAAGNNAELWIGTIKAS